MATGGRLSILISDMMTGLQINDSDVPDIYSCSVCLEHLFDRNPRFLSCHHYFCQPCLQTLTNDARVSCPTCRKVTPVPNNDVTKLTMNFPLVQVMEREQQLDTKRITAKNQCQLCNHEKAMYKCKKCSQIFCKSCTKKHNKMKSFKGHKVLKLCEEHTEGVSHICMKCVKALCIKCVIFYHGDHEEHVEKYKDGENKLRSKLSNISSDLETELDRISNYKRHLVRKDKSAVSEINKFKNERSDLVKQIKQIDLKLQKLEDSQIKNIQEINSCQKNEKKCTSLYISSKELEEASTDVILCEFGWLRQKVKPVRRAINKTAASYACNTALLSRCRSTRSIPYATTNGGSRNERESDTTVFVLDGEGEAVKKIRDPSYAHSAGIYYKPSYTTRGFRHLKTRITDCRPQNRSARSSDSTSSDSRSSDSRSSD